MTELYLVLAALGAMAVAVIVTWFIAQAHLTKQLQTKALEDAATEARVDAKLANAVRLKTAAEIAKIPLETPDQIAGNLWFPKDK